MNGAETSKVPAKAEKNELYRRLAQAKRMVAQPLDAVTKERLHALVDDLQNHIATIEARDADARDAP